MKISLTILGCGTSTGVPIPGCRCAVCTGGHPRNQRSRTSALVTTPAGNILIDASPDLRYQALRENLSTVNAVLYTHAHADHILGTDDLRVFNFGSGQRIPCFGTPETLEQIFLAFRYIFEPDPKYIGGYLAQLDLNEIHETERISVLDCPIQVFPLTHGPFPVVGFRIGELAYATDCNSIPEISKSLLRGVRYLVLDGLRYEPHPSHFTIPEAIAAAQELGPELTYLTHTSHAIDYAEVSAALPAGISLAYDGLKIEFTA